MYFQDPPDKQAYYTQVWALARQIPLGRIATYGQLAKLIPAPSDIDPNVYRTSSPRWVGNAMAACPDDVPWQRVLNAQGKISDRRGAARQKALLQLEDVEFLNDRVDLSYYQWAGPNMPDAPRQPRLF